MTDSQKQFVKGLLKEWACGNLTRLPHDDLGICHNLYKAVNLKFGLNQSDYDEAIYCELLRIVKKWPEYSGDHDYWIKYEDLAPEDAYHSDWINKWDEDYGIRRMACCEFIASKL